MSALGREEIGVFELAGLVFRGMKVFAGGTEAEFDGLGIAVTEASSCSTFIEI